MERSEIIDILARMNALPADADSLASEQIEFDIYRLVEDPIITNRLAVEAIQQLPRNYKFDVVLATDEASQLFAYALAMAAWARFAYADGQEGLVNDYRINKDEKVLIVRATVDEGTSLEDAVDLIADAKAKNAGAISLIALGDAAPLPENFYPLLRFNK
jgi:adenine/guanine phosphoribosyltransferase-like PRPP-binding protein